MNVSRPALGDERVLVLARAALARPRSPFDSLPDRLVLVDVSRQRLTLIEGERPVSEYPASTAAAGIGGEEGSFRTPPGWHRIAARIGAGMPGGAVFESRAPTGAVWRGEPTEDDLIITRILTLEGLEDSVNRGPGCDSLGRYIYIHGTNHLAELGRPASHGCVRLSSEDIAELFERVKEGDAVVIVEGEPGAAA